MAAISVRAAVVFFNSIR